MPTYQLDVLHFKIDLATLYIVKLTVMNIGKIISMRYEIFYDANEDANGQQYVHLIRFT